MPGQGLRIKGQDCRGQDGRFLEVIFSGIFTVENIIYSKNFTLTYTLCHQLSRFYKVSLLTSQGYRRQNPSLESLTVQGHTAAGWQGQGLIQDSFTLQRCLPLHGLPLSLALSWQYWLQKGAAGRAALSLTLGTVQSLKPFPHKHRGLDMAPSLRWTVLSTAQRLRAHWSSGSEPRPSHARPGSPLSAKSLPLTPSTFLLPQASGPDCSPVVTSSPTPGFQVPQGWVRAQYRGMATPRAEPLTRRGQASFLNSKKKTVMCNNENLWEQNR